MRSGGCFLEALIFLLFHRLVINGGVTTAWCVLRDHQSSIQVAVFVHKTRRDGRRQRRTTPRCQRQQQQQLVDNSSIRLLLGLSSSNADRSDSDEDRFLLHQSRRRCISFGSLVSAAIAIASSNVIVPSSLCLAAAPTSAGEAVRRSAANIPGLGPSDVFYPLGWIGVWKVRREVTIPSGESTKPDENNSSESSFTLDYTIRFLPSIDDDAVVADRGYNQANLELAIRSIIGDGGTKTTNSIGSSSSSATTSVVRSYDWIPSNPNDLRLTLVDGSSKEIKVTKRSTERDGTNIFSSEFQRVTTTTTSDGSNNVVVGGIPNISARRVMTKWRAIDDKHLEALEIVYDVGSGMVAGDPSSSQQAASNIRILSKSRLYLER